MNTDSAAPPPIPPIDPPPQYLRLGAEHELKPEDDPEVGGGGGSRSFLRGLLSLVVLAIFGGSIWFAYEQGVRHGMQLAPPLIRSSTKPTKIKPLDPGGMAVPHQDKGVYDRITGERPAAEAQRLSEADETAEPQGTSAAMIASDSEDKSATPLAEVRDAGEAAPPAEPPAAPATKPITVPTPVPTPVPAPPQVAEVPKIVEAPRETVSVAPPPPPPPPTSPLPAADKPPMSLTPPTQVKEAVAPPAPQPEKTPEPEKVAAIPPPAPPPAAKVQPAADPAGWRIQVASYRSAATAQGGWQRLLKTHGDLIGDLKSRVVRADLGARGIFHRLQAGPLANAAAARALCASLQKRKVGCLIVRP